MPVDNDLIDQFAPKIFIIILIIATLVFVSERIIKHKLTEKEIATQSQAVDKKQLILNDPQTKEKKRNTSKPLFFGKGYLTVSSEPAGAEVWVGSTHKGVTPLNLPGLEPGEITLELKHQLAYDETVSAKITKDQVTRIHKVLKLKTGKARFTSNPENARIYIDGKDTLKYTPAELSLIAGEHKVELKLNGYGEYDRENTLLSVIPEQTTAHHTDMEPLASILLDLSPTDSEVTLQNSDLSYQPLVKLPIGKYSFLVSSPGYENKTITVDLKKNTSIPVVLKAEQYSLHFDITPANATIKVKGINDFANGMKLPPGEHEIQFSADGYNDQSLKLDLSKDFSVKVTLQPNYFPEMMLIRGREFQMGGENGNNTPVHDKSVSDFYLGKYEVTIKQWNHCVSAGVCRKLTYQASSVNQPVSSITWNDIQYFINWLNSETGKKFRLPTEAEWEYAADAKGFSNSVSTEICLYEKFLPEKITTSSNPLQTKRYTPSKRNCSNNNNQPLDVGMLIPNKFGIYDLLGNVREWTADCWHPSYFNAPKNGTAWLNTDNGECSKRVVRGGSWKTLASGSYNKLRQFSPIDYSDDHLGFRLALNRLME